MLVANKVNVYNNYQVLGTGAIACFCVSVQIQFVKELGVLLVSKMIVRESLLLTHFISVVNC